MDSLPRNDPLRPAHQAIDAGRFGDALSLLKDVARAQPDIPETYCLAGQCLLRLRDHKAALDAFQRAISIKPEWPEPHLGAARALLGSGDAHASMQTLLRVLDIAPGDLETTRQLFELLVRLQPDSYLSDLQPALYQCFAHPDIDPSPLAGLCGQQLRLGIVDLMDSQSESLPDIVITSIADGKLWRLFLRRVINTDPELEGILTRLRHDLCLRAAIEASEKNLIALIAALAQQCFLNEYVFGVNDEELKKVNEIGRFLHVEYKTSGTAAVAFALSCAYRAPDVDASTRELAEALSANFPWLDDLCRLTVFEPVEESRLAEELSVLHPVHDATSLAVQAQYESNPYPRWEAPPAPPKAPLLEQVRRRFSRRAAAEGATDGARVLIAGCGTGFEPIDIARRDDSAAVTAVDLSGKSLSYAKRKAEALACSNIEFYQGDILDLPRTGWEFDLILCTGVLHHMADPLAGWKVLCDMLNSTGMMRVSLYSAKARRKIRAARERIDAQNLTGQADDIREFRQGLLSDGGDSNLKTLLYSDDFYSMSGCRDLLFHVQERHYTLPEIRVALDQLELRFCGFEFDNAAPIKAFTARNPGPEALRDLQKWDAFEQWHPHTFAGMYQFWCEYEST